MSSFARVLVAEDDFLVSLDIAAKLTEIGCEVAAAAYSGGDAIRLAKELRPDVALMDIRLGDDDGVKIAEEIKAACRIPVIFVSGFSDENTLKRTSQSGAFGHLTKPIRVDELKTTILVALEQSRSRRNLLSRNSWLITMLGSIEEGVVAIDRDGSITFLNSQAESMTGWAFAEVAGKPAETAYSLLSKEGKPASESHLRLALASGVERTRERLILRTRTGQETPIEETVTAIWNEGRIDGALAVFRDLTETLQLQEADKLQTIGTLAGGVAHDFNNLLAIIVGNASLVHDRMPAEGRDRGCLEEIIKAGARAAELTAQLLSYAGQSNSRKKPVDLSRLIGDTEALIRAVVPAQIRITMQAPNALPLVDADAAQLRQVLMNLALNASEAIGEKAGCIEISAGAHDADAVFLRVRDDGCGMDADTRSRAFDPFFSTKFTGRGLGLAAVQGIVRNHLGAIDVHTEPRKGSTFTVVLPVSASAHAATRGLPAQSKPESATVLVVDDMEGVWRFVKTSLERSGFRVLIARDGESAIKIISHDDSEIHAVLLDLSMPGLSGIETGKRIRKLRPSVPICYMSGYTEDFAERPGAERPGAERPGAERPGAERPGAERPGAERPGAERDLYGCFLQKPFTPRQLISKLRYAMETQTRHQSVQ